MVLLWNAFRTQEQLKSATDLRLIASSVRKATAVGDFVAERRNGVAELAERHEIETYLINKALGMSPRYGLNANLDAVEERFRHQVAQKTVRGEPIYNRIVLFDENGETRDAVLIARTPSALRFGDGLALGFERRGEDARAFRSQVHLARGDQTLAATVAVNEPVRFGGWTLYQVNYDPKDPTYSGLDAVFDPGLVVVFAGFALIVLGVAYTLYAEPRLKRRGAAA